MSTSAGEDLNDLQGDADASERAHQRQADPPDILKDLRARFEDLLRPYGVEVEDLEQTLAQVRAAATATTNYIRAKPLQSIGIAAGIGLLLGVLARRRL